MGLIEREEFRRGRALVAGFLGHLYRLPTMSYALNHSQMEAWVALEGLEYFRTLGGTCWETVAFVTSDPVSRNNATAEGLGCKWPDLVCVVEGMSLWFEFKGISRLALRPEAAGGTLAKDVMALAGFRRDATARYLGSGRRPTNGRDDAGWIDASGLRDSLGRRVNIGVALVFFPSDETIRCPRPPYRMWSARHRVEKIEQAIVGSLGPRLLDLRPSITSAVPSDGRALPECAGWLVEMDRSDP